jgi:bla regulator protein blaR1
MRTSSQLLLTFLLNACWQIALIVAFASFGSWLLRHSAARYQHWLWVAALCLSLLVPVTTAVRSAPSGAPVAIQSGYEIQNPVLAENTLPFSSPSTVSTWSFQLNEGLTLTLFLAYGVCLLYGSLRLAQAWRTTRNIRNAAVDVERDETIEAIIRECAKRLNFRNQSVTVCRSVTLPVPVTVGLFRTMIILPDSLLREGDTDLLTSAIGHEYIHVARHDYVLNFIYELLYLPVSFHPAAALMRRRIKQTRELCCDELVAERILNAETYARSLVVLAGSAPPLRRLSVTTTVGIADADILEARVMSLLSKPKMNKRWKRLLLVAVSLLLVIPCVAAAALAMRFEVATNAQEPSSQEPQERERREERERGEVVTRRDQAFKEKMESDPKFREEVQRKMELEVQMREIRQAALVRLAKIPMDQAIQIATSQTPGKVLECTLNAERWEEPGKLAKDGYIFYHVIIADETSPAATHVLVNAVDGSIIRTEKELPRKMRSEN